VGTDEPVVWFERTEFADERRPSHRFGRSLRKTIHRIVFIGSVNLTARLTVQNYQGSVIAMANTAGTVLADLGGTVTVIY